MDANEEVRLAKLDGEVRVALTAMGAKNARLAAKAIDYGKLDFGEDGAVIGLEEQLEALSKSDPYLFSGAGGTPHRDGECTWEDGAGSGRHDGRGLLSLAHEEVRCGAIRRAANGDSRA